MCISRCAASVAAGVVKNNTLSIREARTYGKEDFLHVHWQSDIRGATTGHNHDVAAYNLCAVK